MARGRGFPPHGTPSVLGVGELDARISASGGTVEVIKEEVSPAVHIARAGHGHRVRVIRYFLSVANSVLPVPVLLPDGVLLDRPRPFPVTDFYVLAPVVLDAA